MDKNVGIIGGGIMGLVLAYRLSNQGLKVHLFERAPQLGGLSTWFDYGDFIWDKFYHVILRSDEYLIGLFQELGIHDRLIWRSTKTGFLWRKEHISLSNYKEYLTFPALNFLEKVRLGMGLAYCHMIKDTERLHHVTAKEWLASVFGNKVYEVIWEPLLDSKFGVLKDKIPASIMYSTITRYSSTRSRSDGQECMGTLSGGGLKTFIEHLMRAIIENGGDITCSAIVEKIDEGPNNTVEIVCSDGTYTFDNVISTIPTALLKRMASSCSQSFMQGGMPSFLGVIRLALVLDGSLSPFYITNIIDRGMPFTGIIELGAVVGPDEFRGKNLVMLPRYDIPESEWFRKSDTEIEKAFLDSMKTLWPELDSRIITSFVHKEKYVQALWIETPPAVSKPQRTPDNRIWSINSELSSGHTLSNNSIVKIANEGASEFLKEVL